MPTPRPRPPNGTWPVHPGRSSISPCPTSDSRTTTGSVNRSRCPSDRRRWSWRSTPTTICSARRSATTAGGRSPCSLDRRNVLLTSLFDRAVHRAALGPEGRGPQAEAFRVLRILEPDELESEYPWLTDPSKTVPTWSAAGLAQLVEARARRRWDDGAARRRQEFRSALLAISERCAAADVPFAVLLIPGADRIDPELSDLAVPLRNDRFGDLFDELVAELRAQQIPVLDATPTLRAARSNPEQRAGLFQPGDLRVGPRGAELLGEALAALVAPLLEDR